MGELEGRVAVITGGASGIGAATTRLFVENGARMVVADLPGHARGGDDAAAPLASDQGRRVLHAEKNAAHQYVKGDVPLFDGRLGNGAESTAEPRIVENAVEPAESRLGARYG